MANWAEFPNDVIAHIAKHVKGIEYFISFRAVCTSWKIAATKDNFDVLWPQLPLLMLGAKDDNYREFYSLSKKKVLRLYIPEAKWRTCFSSKGWLICFLQCALEISLLNPFSRNKIQLPPGKNLWSLQGYKAGPEGRMWHFIDKVILSVNPSVTSDYILMVSYYVPSHDGLGGCYYLAFLRHRDLNGTKIDCRNWVE
ncbi:hypothetical protein BC332_08441 [Capsicum chinense]|nr:hypothetical protein BC332_08441 [Capsicum chinense]